MTAETIDSNEILRQSARQAIRRVAYNEGILVDIDSVSTRNIVTVGDRCVTIDMSNSTRWNNGSLSPERLHDEQTDYFMFTSTAGRWLVTADEAKMNSSNIQYDKKGERFVVINLKCCKCTSIKDMLASV